MHAKKRLGQNFLHDLGVLSKIIEAGELSEKDTVVEIGPGRGFLTDELVKKAGHIIAVELDEDLLPGLKAGYLTHKNFTLVHGDALKFTPPTETYKLVANIPYYITSPLLNHFLVEQFTGGNPPALLVVMVQKEVAEKIIAKKGKHSVLSLQVHLFGDPELVCPVPKQAFRPIPQVDSAVIKIRVNKEPKIKGDLKKLFWLFHISFAQKRKKLTNNLSSALRKPAPEIRELLTSLQINPDIRAEDLNMEEWQKLFNELG
jgi:16S rRNA (adenine1518-N6/adenine1519-N6)-dimethyltransferase